MRRVSSEDGLGVQHDVLDARSQGKTSGYCSARAGGPEYVPRSRCSTLSMTNLGDRIISERGQAGFAQSKSTVSPHA